ncbi:CPBP family glutamic-type intramembrane protease [Paenibacillus segetis]|uniref:CAAX prenyl protease 2/Lysostaphin resistance protein A-like domain-containing protein n=1 Tax=Paenibacillus segetis TaxID=1325360 RepID=A0ABQ1YNB8_9BACL|nr:CPBP family glutamic-type intramembrane protease [Paenibacillus segetis]GGH30939.1 hypothetical protein GCM10008013_34360 [Paenibacillus segetis]
MRMEQVSSLIKIVIGLVILQNSKIPFAILMKVVTGLIFGIVLGVVRYKTKNCYSTTILHSVMNIFGR